MSRKMKMYALLLAVSACGWAWIAQAQNQEKPDTSKKPATKKTAPAAAPEKAPEKPADKSPEADDEKAIRAGAAAYVKAYNAHTPKALAELFALRAEFVNE